MQRQIIEQNTEIQICSSSTPEGDDHPSMYVILVGDDKGDSVEIQLHDFMFIVRRKGIKYPGAYDFKIVCIHYGKDGIDNWLQRHPEWEFVGSISQIIEGFRKWKRFYKMIVNL